MKGKTCEAQSISKIVDMRLEALHALQDRVYRLHRLTVVALIVLAGAQAALRFVPT